MEGAPGEQAEGPGGPYPPGPASYPTAHPLGIHRAGSESWNLGGAAPGGVRSDWDVGVPGYSLAGTGRRGGFAPPAKARGPSSVLRVRGVLVACVIVAQAVLLCASRGWMPPAHPTAGTGPVHPSEWCCGTGAPRRSAPPLTVIRLEEVQGRSRAGSGQRAGARVHACGLHQGWSRREGAPGSRSRQVQPGTG